MLLSVLVVSQLIGSVPDGSALHGLPPSFSPTFGQFAPFANTLPTIRSNMPQPLKPSADNHCGRDAAVYLAPVAATHMIPPYPHSAVKNGEEGLSQVMVVVDKDGNPTGMRIAASSGYADLDEAAITAVSKFKWAKPANACAEMGVQQVVKLDWDMAIPTVAIAANSADYPAAAKAANLSGVGAVLVTQTGDDVTAVKMNASTGSAELDKAMLSFAHDKITMPSLMRDGKALTTTMQFLVRFSPDPARPATVLAPNLPDSVMDDPTSAF